MCGAVAFRSPPDGVYHTLVTTPTIQRRDEDGGPLWSATKENREGEDKPTREVVCENRQHNASQKRKKKTEGKSQNIQELSIGFGGKNSTLFQETSQVGTWF